MHLIARPLSAEAMAPYGWLFTATVDRFQIMHRVAEAKGWQAALNKVVDRAVSVLGRHLNTDECFAPLHGRTVVLLAPYEKPRRIEAFLLTEPICVRAGVWHASLTLDPHALIFICEAAEVISETCELPEPITC